MVREMARKEKKLTKSKLRDSRLDASLVALDILVVEQLARGRVLFKDKKVHQKHPSPTPGMHTDNSDSHHYFRHTHTHSTLHGNFIK